MKQFNITQKQLDILLLLYRFRFLNTKIIQLLLKHKLPTRIQEWLKDLTDKRYLHQFYDKSSFVTRTKPAIYCLSTKARKILKKQKECNAYILTNLYRERQRSIRFQEHCCDIALIFYQTKKRYKNNTIFDFFTKVELVGYMHFPQPLPDAYFAIKQKGKKIQRYFLELFDEKIPRRFIKSKIRRYITSSEGEWNEQTHVEFPPVLLVAQNLCEQKKIMRAAKTVLNEEYSDLSFYTTIKDQILAEKITTIIWKKVEI
jgi:hypothetical protein